MRYFIIIFVHLFFTFISISAQGVVDSTSIPDSSLSVDSVSGSLFAEKVLYEKKVEEALKYSLTKLLGTENILVFVDASLMLVHSSSVIEAGSTDESLPGFSFDHIFRTQPTNIKGDKKDIYNFTVAIKNLSVKILVDKTMESNIGFINETVTSLLSLDTKRGDSVIIKAVPFSHKTKNQIFDAILGQVTDTSITGWVVSFLILFIAVFIVISIVLASSYHKEAINTIVNLESQIAELKNIKEVKIPVIYSEPQPVATQPAISVQEDDEPKHFKSFRKLKMKDKIAVLEDEKPSVIAIVLSHLNPKDSATIMQGLSPNKQVEVARSLGAMTGTQRDVLQKVENAIDEKVNSIINPPFIPSGGVKCLADILSNAGYETEKKVLDALQVQNSEMANEVSKLIFGFDDLFDIDDTILESILREVDRETIALAIKGASEKMKAKIYKNVSSRMKEMLEEDVAVLRFIKQDKIDSAQRRIIEKVRELGKVGVEGKEVSSNQVSSKQ